MADLSHHTDALCEGLWLVSHLVHRYTLIALSYTSVHVFLLQSIRARGCKLLYSTNTYGVFLIGIGALTVHVSLPWLLLTVCSCIRYASGKTSKPKMTLLLCIKNHTECAHPQDKDMVNRLGVDFLLTY